MFFSWEWKIQGFLFEDFNIDTLEKCLLVIFIVFCMAYLYESIKILQKVINKRFQLNWLPISPSTQNTEETPLVESLRIPINHDEIKKRRLQNHIIQSLMYMLNLTIGYVLMLIAMVMYSGHFLALILGFTFGYYFLNVISPDFYASVSDKSINLHTNGSCHDQPRTSRDITYDQI